MLDMAFDYSGMENFLLQSVTSVITVADPSKRTASKEDRVWNLGGAPMPQVKSTTHMGIPRSEVKFSKEEVTVDIQKARRAMYGLMPAGLHGENGLDPQTAVHVFQIYVLPVILYGMEVAVPSKTNLDILSREIPQNFAQAGSISTYKYCFTCCLHTHWDLTSRGYNSQEDSSNFWSICRLSEESVEKRLGRRQLSIKSYSSHSWFVIVKELLIKYDLGSPFLLLDAKLSKTQWRVRVAKAVNSFWSEKLTFEASLYSTLKNMNCTLVVPGKCYPLLFNLSSGANEASRIPVRLRIATGTYILQSNRAVYNQFECDATCKLCEHAQETLTHFLLDYKALQECRQPIMTDIESACESLCDELGISTLGIELDKLIIDCSSILVENADIKFNQLKSIQFHSARLCFALHCLRFKKLGLVPKSKIQRKANNQ